MYASMPRSQWKSSPSGITKCRKPSAPDTDDNADEEEEDDDDDDDDDE